MGGYGHPAYGYGHGYGYAGPFGAYSVEQMAKCREAEEQAFKAAQEQAEKIRADEQKRYEEYIAAEQKAYADAEKKHREMVEAEQKQYEEYVEAQRKAIEEAAAKEREFYEKERALHEKLGGYPYGHPYGYQQPGFGYGRYPAYGGFSPARRF